nr:hypothetical protein [uncultured Sphingomonas sp.]
MPPEKLSDIETWNYENGPLPPEWWSYAQETPATYQWEYKWADDEQLQLAFECDLPEAHSWDEMRRRDPLFDDISCGDIKSCKGGMNIVGDFISAKRDLGFEDIDDNVKKVWLFILLVSSIDRQKFDKIFAPAFFDGIVMPCHESGPGTVRVLRWIGS